MSVYISRKAAIDYIRKEAEENTIFDLEAKGWEK